MGFFAWIGQGCKWLFKLVALPVAKLGAPSVRPYVRWTLHAVCVLALIGCLGYLNFALQLDKVVRAPVPLLRWCWLPLLFVLVYCLAWLGWWCWKVATSPAGPARFPDLQDAWREGLRALDLAGIDLAKTPVYLVVGRTEAGDTEFFQAMNLAWDVPPTPRSGDAPLRLCATKEAMFVSLAGASASSRLSAALSALDNAKETHGPSSDALADDKCDDAAVEVFGGGVATATATATRKTAQRGLELIEQSLAMLAAEERIETARDTSGSTLLSDAEVEEATQRLEYVCQLLAESRLPYCPANGILALVAWQATASAGRANRAAVLLDHDLATIQRELQLLLPRVVIVTDIETTPGCRTLVTRMPADQRGRRFGVRFPQLADCDAAKWPAQAAMGVQWLCRALLPALVYRVLSAGSGDEGTRSWPGNVQLYRFMEAFAAREARLARILERGLSLASGGGTMLHGLYLAATGDEKQASQAFLAGVMPQVLEMQNSVAWTEEALQQNAACRRYTRWGYAALAVVVITLAGLAWRVSI